MSILSMIASFPMIKSRRVARDLMEEFDRHGMTISIDEDHQAMDARLLAGESLVEDPEYVSRIMLRG